ncbi:hypothetical protein ACWFQ8_30045 [Streptomyces sp. NPDC055254]
MNTRSIAGAARVICKALAKNRVPATIAMALDASGWLNTTEAAAELVRLRLLQNAQPAELSEAQTEALADAGNRALNDHYHEDLCACSDWPKGCASSGNYFAGSWDTAAFSIGMAAVIGVWESMRAPAEADRAARHREELRVRRNEDMALRGELSPSGGQRAVPFELGESLVPAVQWLIARVAERPPVDDERIALIRKRRTHCEVTRFETEDERPLHVWGPSQYPGRDMCQRCTTERKWAEDPDADEVVLLAEVDRLRARVAELEAAAYGDAKARLFSPVEQIRHLHDCVAAQQARADTLDRLCREEQSRAGAAAARVAELETSARGCDGEGCVLPHSSWCTRAREFAAQHSGCTCGEPWKDTPQTHAGHCWLLSPPWDEMEWHRKRVAELLAQVAKLEAARSRPAPVLAPVVQPDARRDESVAKLRDLIAGQREDTYVSPLHTDYRLGHDLDLPEAPSV